MIKMVSVIYNANFNFKGLVRNCVLDAPNGSQMLDEHAGFILMHGWVLSVKRPDSVRLVVRDGTRSQSFSLEVDRADVARHFADVQDIRCGFEFCYPLRDDENILNVYLNIDAEEAHWFTLAFADVHEMNESHVAAPQNSASKLSLPAGKKARRRKS